MFGGGFSYQWFLLIEFLQRTSCASVIAQLRTVYKKKPFFPRCTINLMPSGRITSLKLQDALLSSNKALKPVIGRILSQISERKRYAGGAMRSHCHCIFSVRSCLLITLVKCLKGYKRLKSLSDGVCMSKSKRSLYVCSVVLSEWFRN